MSNSVWPHRRQPIRLPCPWDFPGKNSGVGCHFLLQWMKVKSESEVAESFLTLSDPMDCSLPGSSVHGIFQARVLEWVPLPCLLCNEDLVLRKFKKKKKISPRETSEVKGKQDMKTDETSLGLISCKSWRGKLQPVFIGNLGYKLCLKRAPTQGWELGFHSPTSASLSSFNKTQMVSPSLCIRSYKDKSKVTLEAKHTKAQENVTSDNV